MHIYEIIKNGIVSDFWIVENPQNLNRQFLNFCEQLQENIQGVMKFYIIVSLMENVSFIRISLIQLHLYVTDFIIDNRVQ